MQLTISDETAHRMAKELALLTGESVNEAVTKAIEDRLLKERQRLAEGRGDLRSRIAPIVARMKTLPVLDDRPGDDLLYDRDGLPQ